MRELVISIGRFSKFSKNLPLSANETIIVVQPFKSEGDVFVLTLESKKGVRRIVPIVADESKPQLISAPDSNTFFVERKSLFKKTWIRLTIS